MDDLLYHADDGVGVVTFNRPESRNALTFEMYAELARICRETPADGSIKALVLRGAGDRAFAAGTDMAEFRGFSTERDALDYEAKMDGVLGDLERCPVPTIAAIAGACTGGGAAIAAACDLRICDRKLRFGFPIARTLGNCLSIGNLARLSALVGYGRLREIVFTARLIEADEADRIGLVGEVLPDAAAVYERAAELADSMKRRAPLTLRATKEALRRLRNDGPGAEDSDLIALCYTSADFKEGMDAFLTGRSPDWRGA